MPSSVSNPRNIGHILAATWVNITYPHSLPAKNF